MWTGGNHKKYTCGRKVTLEFYYLHILSRDSRSIVTLTAQKTNKAALAHVEFIQHLFLFTHSSLLNSDADALRA